MSNLDGLDLGVVTDVTAPLKTTIVRDAQNGGINTVPRAMNVNESTWTISGFMLDQTLAQCCQYENIEANHLITFVDLSDVVPNIIGYCKCEQWKWTYKDSEAGIFYYEAQIIMVSAVGCTRNTNMVGFLHDLNYRASQMMLDPCLHYCNKTWSTDRTQFQYEFYVDNYDTGTDAPILEIDCFDYITRVDVYAWKSGAYALVGQWGGGYTAFGTAVSFTDENSTVHQFNCGWGQRGTSANGIGTVSLDLGCQTRILLSISNLLNNTGFHVPTIHGNSQLQLRINIVGYNWGLPVMPITYIDGGMDYGHP